MASDSSEEELPNIFTSYRPSDSPSYAEEAVKCYMQLAVYFLDEKRSQRSIRKHRTVRRSSVFCKKGLTLMHQSMASRFGKSFPSPGDYTLPRNTLRLSQDPELQTLSSISIFDLSCNTKHTGRVLYGTLCVDPFICKGQMTVLEDPESPGCAVRVVIYNFPNIYPPGIKIAIKEPHLKLPHEGIRVKDPGRSIVEVESFPLGLELRGMEKLRRRGDECLRRKEWLSAVELYTRCIDKFPASCDSAAIRSECLLVPYSNRAAAYLELEERDKALGDADKALEMDPWHAKSLYLKGRALEELGRYVEAVECMSKAKEEAESAVDREDIASALERVTRKTEDENTVD